MKCGINLQQIQFHPPNLKNVQVIVVQMEHVIVKNKMELNYSRLNGEYLSWSIENGDGRNKEDQRFGQYLMV